MEKITMLDEISKVINDKREIRYDAFKCQDYLSQMEERVIEFAGYAFKCVHMG